MTALFRGPLISGVLRRMRERADESWAVDQVAAAEGLSMRQARGVMRRLEQADAVTKTEGGRTHGTRCTSCKQYVPGTRTEPKYKLNCWCTSEWPGTEGICPKHQERQ